MGTDIDRYRALLVRMRVLTEAMHEAADAGDWETLQRFADERDAVTAELETCARRGPGPTADDAELLAETLALNEAMIALTRAGLEQVAKLSRRLQDGRQASRAYRQHQRMY